MLYRRGKTWWYKFKLYGQTVRESSHSHSKTVARQAEMSRRRELELAINRIGKPRERMPLFSVAADEWHKSLRTTGDEGLSPRTVSRYLQCLSPLKKPSAIDWFATSTMRTFAFIREPALRMV